MFLRLSFSHSSPATSPRDPTEDNRLVVFQFLINALSLELQSQGKALLELQVTGVQADLQTKPGHKSLALTVHGLLLVDALQVCQITYVILTTEWSRANIF